MNMKVYYRSPVVWNLIVFVVFSFLFLYLQDVFYNLSSVRNKEMIIGFLKENKFIIIVMVITIGALYELAKSSKLFVALTTILCFAKTCLNLNEEFSKIILVLLFFYLLLAYYLYQFFSMDIEESYYNPCFDSNLLFDPMLERIDCDLLSIDGETVKVKAYLTNWSLEGCFLYFLDEYSAKGEYLINIKFKEHEFRDRVQVVSSLKNSTGCGVKFNRAANRQNEQNLGWNDFYGIIEHMGYFPELMR